MKKLISVFLATIAFSYVIAKSNAQVKTEKSGNRIEIYRSKNKINSGSYTTQGMIFDETTTIRVTAGGPTTVLNFGPATITGDPHYSIINDSCSGNGIPLGQECSVTVRFEALVLGTAVANFSLPYTWSPTGETGSVIQNHSNRVIPSYVGDRPNPPGESRQLTCPGSIIRMESQSIGEVVDITGTGISLVYSSEFSQSYSSINSFGARKSFFNPNGWTVSIQHMYSYDLNRMYRGDGSSEYRFNDDSDPTGLLAVVSEDASEVYTFTRGGKHVKTQYGLTGVTKYTFNYSTFSGQEYLTSIVDAFGKVISFNRNSSGILQSVTAPFGQITAIGMSSSGLISSIQSPHGDTHSFTYKAATDLLETFTKPGGQTSSFTYGSTGRLTQDLGHGGNFWSFVEDLQIDQRLVTQTSAMGRINKNYSWGANGTTSIYVSSASGQEYESGVAPMDGASYKWTPQEERWEIMTYHGRFIGLSSRPYLTALDVNGVSRRTEYGQTVVNKTDSFIFDSITDTATTNGKTSSSTYTTANKTRIATSPEGATTKLEINSYELPVSTQIGSDTPVTYTYDASGRLQNIVRSGSNLNTNTYNLNGYLATSTDVLGNQVSYSYDSAGRISQKTFPNGNFVTYSYDVNGNLTGVTPPGRPEHVFQFNAMELISQYQPPALSGLTVKDTTYTYNLDKQLTNILRPDMQSIAFVYGSTTGLLDQVQLARGINVYSYLTSSNLVSQVDSADGISSSFGYYGRGVSSEQQKRTSDGYLYASYAYGYDGEHRPVSRTLRGHSSASTSVINTTYNNDDLPVQIGSLTLAYSYPSGRLSTTNLDNISDQRTYDANGNIATYTTTYADPVVGATVLYSYSLLRDAADRITTKTENVLGTSAVYVYTYDILGRLKTVTLNGAPYSSYNYDDNGNRTSGTHATHAFAATYDNQDRLLTFNSRVYSYNANGDNTHIQWNTTQQSSFSYDAQGSLIGAVNKDGRVLALKYDGNNRLVQTDVDGATTTRRIYENDLRIAAQYTNGGNNLKEFIYATNVNSPDYMIFEGVRYRFIKDHLGSPRLIVKSTDGTVAQRIDYTDLGKITANTNTSFQPFAFAGGINENYTRLVKFGARYYDPETGRWTTKDPIGFTGGDSNLYTYVSGDPNNLKDPFGLEYWEFDRDAKTLSLFNDDNQRIGKWSAGSGPWGKGKLDEGTYSLIGSPSEGLIGHPKRSSFCDPSGNCWFQPLSSKGDRKGLGVHPDGGTPGTEGCIGATGEDTSSLLEFIKLFGRKPLYVK